MDHYLLNIKSIIDKKNNLSIEKLASEVGTTRVTMSKYLNEKTVMPITMFNSICEVLNVSPCEILEKDFQNGKEFGKYPTEHVPKVLEQQSETKDNDNNIVEFLQNQIKEKDRQINDLIQVIGGQAGSKEAV